MRRRHPRIPVTWLMTDERMGAEIWTALERLPRGSGVVFRHYSLAPAERRALFAAVARVARRRGLVLLRGGDMPMRGEAGVHGGHRRGLHTASAHRRSEAVVAIRAGAKAVFVSPVFATRSHPGARVLGPVRFGLLAQGVGVPVIALGGMDSRKARRTAALGAHGWAGIDVWL